MPSTPTPSWSRTPLARRSEAHSSNVFSNLLVTHQFHLLIFLFRFLVLQLGNFLHYMGTFVSGFVVGFTAVWQLALVTLAVVPLIAVIGGIHTTTLAKLSAKAQDALSQAGNIVEQVEIFLFPPSCLVFRSLIWMVAEYVNRRWCKYESFWASWGSREHSKRIPLLCGERRGPDIEPGLPKEWVWAPPTSSSSAATPSFSGTVVTSSATTSPTAALPYPPCSPS